MTDNRRIEEVKKLLEELEAILDREGETNWIQGVSAILRCLVNPHIEDGYNEARSIYTTMAVGKGAFSDFYIQRADPLQQAEANRRLDEIRDRLWEIFQA